MQVIVEFDVPMTTADGVALRSDVYRPDTGRWPALLTRTPYSKAMLAGLMAFINPVRAAREGFAVVVQDVRGRFKSEGQYVPFEDEAEDGAAAIAWVSSQPWCNGKVAMFGSSYMAATQMLAAPSAPRSLAALCPIQAVSDYYEGRSFRGGAFEMGALASIALWNQAPGILLRKGLPKEAQRRYFAEIRAHLSNLKEFLSVAPYDSLRQSVLGAAAPFFFDWWEHDRKDDPFWEKLSVEARYESISVPALHVTSWYDQFHVGTLRNYEGLRARAATATAREGQALIVGPWGHYPPKSSLLGAARVGDLDFGLDAFVDLEATQIAWYRRWLHADESAWRQQKRVRLFVMGRNTWRDEDEWPLAHARDTPLYLAKGADRARDLSFSPGETGSDTYSFDPANPVPTCGGAHLVLDSVFPQGPLDQRAIQRRDDVLVYSTSPLAGDVEVTGWVKAVLWVRSSAPSTDFTAKLVDTWPDGRSFNVCDGIRRVVFAGLESDGGWSKVTVELGATSMVFLRGHRISAQISSSNFPRFDLNPNTGEPVRLASKRVSAVQEVSIGGAHASHLLLPLVAD